MRSSESITALIALLAGCTTTMPFSSHAFAAAAEQVHCTLGTLQPLPNGDYAMDAEAARIPRRLKTSGFRWGMAFDNPGEREISWYEILRLPGSLKRVKSEVNHSKAPVIVDQFWFNEGDPLGPYTLELYINGERRCTKHFEVYEPK